MEIADAGCKAEIALDAQEAWKERVCWQSDVTSNLPSSVKLLKPRERAVERTSKARVRKSDYGQSAKNVQQTTTQQPTHFMDLLDRTTSTLPKNLPSSIDIWPTYLKVSLGAPVLQKTWTARRLPHPEPCKMAHPHQIPPRLPHRGLRGPPPTGLAARRGIYTSDAGVRHGRGPRRPRSGRLGGRSCPASSVGSMSEEALRENGVWLLAVFRGYDDFT